MCDLKKSSKLRTATVYKVCWKVEGEYYAVFSGLKISTGLVIDMEFAKRIDGLSFRMRHGYEEGYGLYNVLAVGRTTGFKSKKIAEGVRQLILARGLHELVVLKMIITDDLVRGTGQKIMSSYAELNTAIVYAGKYVVSFEEIDTSACLSETERIRMSNCASKRREERAAMFKINREKSRKARAKRIELRNKRKAEMIPV